MKALILALVGLLLSACASVEQNEADFEKDKAERLAAIAETRAYLESAKLETVSTIRYRKPLKWEYVNNQFVTVETNTGKYLVEVQRYCPDLAFDDRQRTWADRQAGAATISASIGDLRVFSSSIRNCTVAAIYQMPEDAAEADPES